MAARIASTSRPALRSEPTCSVASGVSAAMVRETGAAEPYNGTIVFQEAADGRSENTLSVKILSDPNDDAAKRIEKQLNEDFSFVTRLKSIRLPTIRVEWIHGVVVSDGEFCAGCVC